MAGQCVDGNDVEAVYRLSLELLNHCRSGKGPALIEAVTYRMRGHGEKDHQHYVDPMELNAWAAKCPIRRYRQALLKTGVLDEDQMQTIRRPERTRQARWCATDPGTRRTHT